ncbi:hypothetical protein S245_069544, partial [Arachis hypogaea]
CLWLCLYKGMWICWLCLLRLLMLGRCLLVLCLLGSCLLILCSCILLMLIRLLLRWLRWCVRLGGDVS